MRKHLLALTALTAALAALTALPVSAKTWSYYYVYDGSLHDIVMKPTSLSVNNQDSLLKLSWRSWGGKVATASGQYGLAVCTPDCAHGHYQKLPAQAQASAAFSCPGSPAVHIYGRVSIVVPRKPTLNWTLKTDRRTACAALASH